MIKSFFKLGSVLATLLILLTLGNLPAHAQAVYGSIYGTVLDNTGAVVVNASIVVKSVQKDTSFAAQSNAVGEYRIDHLIADTYDVTISAAGFKTFSVKGLPINAGEAPKIDARLEVGTVSQSITVNASAEDLLKTETQDVSLFVEQTVVADLPIPFEGVNNLIMLAPGVQDMFGAGSISGEYPTANGLYTIDGQTTGNLDFVLDGTDDTSPILDITVINPPPDTLSSVKIVTASMDADVGKAMSASVPMETKSGSNVFHGEVNDFRTSSANLARNPYSAAQNAPNGLAPALSNAFEGNIGGPILKNRLFFFFDYFGRRERIGGSTTTTVPTKTMHDTCLGNVASSDGTLGSCDFGDYLTAGEVIYYPTGNPATPYLSYPNNIIPKAQISQQALNIMALLPYPNTPGTTNGTVNNYSANGTGITNTGQYTERVDYHLNDKLTLFSRYTYFHDVLNGNTIFGVLGGAGPSGIGNPATGHDHNGTAGLAYMLSNTLTMDLRLGFYRLNELNLKYDEGVNLETQLGIPGLNGTGYPLVDGASSFTAGNLSFGNNCNCELIEDEYQYQIVNNWTKIFKTHTIKWGVDLRYGQNLRVSSDTNRAGNLTFGTGPTEDPQLPVPGGLGLATFMLGDVTNFGRYVSQTSNAKEMQKRTFFYGTDSWRVTPKLTANYGLRWEIYFPETVNGPGNGGALNLTTGLIAAAGEGGIPSNMGFKDVLTNFAPRVGLSYQLNSKTVVRVGYGRAYGMGVYGTIFGHATTQNIPSLANQEVNSNSLTGSVFNLAQGPAPFVFPAIPSNGEIPLPNGVTASSRPNPLRYQSLDSWNASIQRAITGTLTVTAAYVGNKGTHIWAGNFEYVNPNPPFTILPASESVTGSALSYDPNPTTAVDGPTNPQYPTVYADGHTSNLFYLLPLYAKFGWTQAINYYCNCSNSHYNALQLTVEKRFSHGLNVTANYAWQHANNYDSSYFAANKKIEYGPQDQNRNQVLTAYGFYQLPFGRQGDFFKTVPRWADDVIGGWRLSPSVSISSGLPFSMTYANCNLNVPPALPEQAGASGAPCWPNQNGKFNVGLGKFANNTRSYFTPFSPFNPLSKSNPTLGPFSYPSLDQVGNSGRNTFWGPSFWNADMALEKNVTLWENAKGQFRMDAYNVFNHMAASVPGVAPFVYFTCIDCFGPEGQVISLANGSVPRQLDFAGKITF